MSEGSYNRVLAMKREIWERFESKLTSLGDETTWDTEQPWMTPSRGTACWTVESGFEEVST